MTKVQLQQGAGATVEATAAFSSRRQTGICFRGGFRGTGLLLELWPRALSKAEFQAQESDAESEYKEELCSHQAMAQWPGFLCHFRVIFHSDNESDGSGVFHVLIVNVLTGPLSHRVCWD